MTPTPNPISPIVTKGVASMPMSFRFATVAVLSPPQTLSSPRITRRGGVTDDRRC